MTGSGVDIDTFILKAREKIVAVVPLVGAVLVVLLSDPSAAGKVYRLCCVLKVITPELSGNSSSSSSSGSSDGSNKGRGGGGQSQVMVRVFDGMQVSRDSALRTSTVLHVAGLSTHFK